MAVRFASRARSLANAVLVRIFVRWQLLAAIALAVIAAAVALLSRSNMLAAAAHGAGGAVDRTWVQEMSNRLRRVRRRRGEIDTKTCKLPKTELGPLAFPF